MASIKGEKTLTELAQGFDVHADQVTQWKNHFLEGVVGVFGGEAKAGWIAGRRANGNAVKWERQSLIVTAPARRRVLISRMGGLPKKRLYSRLNWLALS